MTSILSFYRVTSGYVTYRVDHRVGINSIAIQSIQSNEMGIHHCRVQRLLNTNEQRKSNSAVNTGTNGRRCLDNELHYPYMHRNQVHSALP